MPKLAYIDKRFQSKSLAIIEQANKIIEDYQVQGYDLTLRQLYYQFVARDIIPNSQREYKKLGSTINDARLAGLIDWEAIVDRTRNTVANSHWGSPREIVEACASQFKIDTRATQDNYIEVWVEKEALAGVIERTCRKADVLSFACRGYVSQSAMWEAAQRILKQEGAGKSVTILHLGDHDPSGIDMTRDIRDRLDLFGTTTIVNRIALTMKQIEHYGPPPNFAPITDSRSGDYIRKFGMNSWELDALEPKVLDALIKKHIAELTDVTLLKKAHVSEQVGRDRLQEVVEELE